METSLFCATLFRGKNFNKAVLSVAPERLSVCVITIRIAGFAAREHGLLLSLVASFSFLCRIMFETASFVLWNIDLQRPNDCTVLSLSLFLFFLTARTAGLGLEPSR